MIAFPLLSLAQLTTVKTVYVKPINMTTTVSEGVLHGVGNVELDPEVIGRLYWTITDEYGGIVWNENVPWKSGYVSVSDNGYPLIKVPFSYDFSVKKSYGVFSVRFFIQNKDGALVAQGHKKIEVRKEGAQTRISNLRVETVGDEFDVFGLVFQENAYVSDKVRFVPRLKVYEYEIDGVEVLSLSGDMVELLGRTKEQVSFTFPVPKVPKVYVVEVFAEDEWGDRLTPSLRETFVIEGAFAHADSFSSSHAQFAETGNMVDFEIRGLVRRPRDPLLVQATIQQFYGDKKIESVTTQQTLELEESRFLAQFEYEVVEQGATHFAVSVRLLQNGEVLEESSFITDRFEAAEIEEVEGWSWGILWVCVFGIFLFLAWFFFVRKVSVKLPLVLLGVFIPFFSVLAEPLQGSMDSSDLVFEWLYPQVDTHFSTNPERSSFRYLFFQGRFVNSITNSGALRSDTRVSVRLRHESTDVLYVTKDMNVQSLHFDIVKNDDGDVMVVDDDFRRFSFLIPTVDGEIDIVEDTNGNDVYDIADTVVSWQGLPDGSYEMSLVLRSTASNADPLLTDTQHVVLDRDKPLVRFLFERTQDVFDFEENRSEPPIFFVNDDRGVRTRVECQDDSGCFDPDGDVVFGGTGALASQWYPEYFVKGNFCDSGDDYCYANEKIRGFEVCDVAGNCTDYTQAESQIMIRFYDPQSPEWQEEPLVIEQEREYNNRDYNQSQGGASRDYLYGEGRAGASAAEQSRLSFGVQDGTSSSMVLDQTPCEPASQSSFRPYPGSDPQYCGMRMYPCRQFSVLGERVVPVSINGDCNSGSFENPDEFSDDGECCHWRFPYCLPIYFGTPPDHCSGGDNTDSSCESPTPSGVGVSSTVVGSPSGEDVAWQAGDSGGACFVECSAGYVWQNGQCEISNSNSCESPTPSGAGVSSTVVGSPSGEDVVWQAGDSGGACFVECSAGYYWNAVNSACEQELTSGCEDPDIALGGYFWASCNAGATDVYDGQTIRTSAGDSTVHASDRSFFGGYYQWSRNQNVMNTGTLFAGPVTESVANSTTQFIRNSNGAGDRFDWVTPVGSVRIWQLADTRQGPCADGYQVPSSSVWQSAINDAGSVNTVGTRLKLPKMGLFRYNYGHVGNTGAYWSSSSGGYTGQARAFVFGFDPRSSGLGVNPNYHRWDGLPVRCVKTPLECKGSVPSNANLCSGDSNLLTSDTPVRLTDSCSAAHKCEYVCKSGYVLENGACVQDLSCASPMPSGIGVSSTVVGNPLSSGVAWQNSNNTQACFVECSAGYVWQNGQCEELPKECSGTIWSNSVECNGYEVGLSQDRTTSLLNACTSSTSDHCHRTCAEGYRKRMNWCEAIPGYFSCDDTTKPSGGVVLNENNPSSVNVEWQRSNSSGECYFRCDTNHTYNESTNTCEPDVQYRNCLRPSGMGQTDFTVNSVTTVNLRAKYQWTSGDNHLGGGNPGYIGQYRSVWNAQTRTWSGSPTPTFSRTPKVTDQDCTYSCAGWRTENSLGIYGPDSHANLRYNTISNAGSRWNGGNTCVENFFQESCNTAETLASLPDNAVMVSGETVAKTYVWNNSDSLVTTLPTSFPGLTDEYVWPSQWVHKSLDIYSGRCSFECASGYTWNRNTYRCE